MAPMKSHSAEAYLLVSFAGLAVIPLLFILRFLDNNRLTSWQWVFADGGLGIVYMLIVPAIILSYLFSRFAFPEHFQDLFLFFAALAISAFLWDIPEVLLDTARYFIQAKSLAFYGPGFFWEEWGRAITAWTDLPLIPFLYGLLFKLFGEARIVIQVFNSLLFASTVVLISRIGALLWDKTTGFYAGLMLLAIPYLPTQVPLLLVDVATMFFLILTVYFYLKALTAGGFFWCSLSCLGLLLALFSKYSTWPMLCVLPVITLVYLHKNPARIIRRALLIGLVSALIGGFFFLLKHNVFLEQIHLLRTYQVEGLKRWQEGYISSFFFQVYPLVTLAALWGIFRAFREKDYRFLVAGWFGIFVFILQVKRMRYMIPLLPLLALMAAYGLNGLHDERLKKFSCYIAVFSSLIILFAVYRPFLLRTSMNNLQEAGHYLDTLPEENISVLLLPQHVSSGSTFVALPILDLFTRKNLRSETLWAPPAGHPEFMQRSLRFSWEMQQPDFYLPAAPNGTTSRVIIASQDPFALQDVTGEQKKQAVMKKFDQHTGVFRYKTLVTILSP